MKAIDSEPFAGTGSSASRIRVGIGGWTFEPWRGSFYPAGWPQAKELHYASRQFSAIEINGTYYSSQKPETFAKWRDETPDEFMFSLKASRFCTNRRVLADAGESVQRFVESGIAELGPKLGPILWQLAPTKVFDPADLGRFLELLPKQVRGVPLRHVLDVRHHSFKCAEYLALARRLGVATVFTDSDDYPSFADITGDVVYVRTMRTAAGLAVGFEAPALAQLAACCRAWQSGQEPAGLPRIESMPAATLPRDVFMFFIAGAKEKAPAAAVALGKVLGPC